jgi:hypothetical protein
VARQPILTKDEKVFGYELLFRDGVEIGTARIRPTAPQIQAQNNRDNELMWDAQRLSSASLIPNQRRFQQGIRQREVRTRTLRLCSPKGREILQRAVAKKQAPRKRKLLAIVGIRPARCKVGGRCLVGRAQFSPISRGQSFPRRVNRYSLA